MIKIANFLLKNKAKEDNISIQIASIEHVGYVQEILDTIEAAAKVRGTGIAKRSPEYVEQKIKEGKAVIALNDKQFAGFCYIESWGNKKFVANSGLIVADEFRKHGLARKIKQHAFALARYMFPEAKVFGLTSGAAVMNINTGLGYKPVTFAQLTDDESFWKGCQGCVNYDVLTRTERKYCICTAMLFDPQHQKDTKEVKNIIKEIKKKKDHE